MKKIVLLSLLTIGLLYAKENVHFNFADDSKDRKFPSNKEYILSYNNILKDIKTSVVNISTQKNIQAQNMYANPLFKDPFFRDFFRGYGHGNIVPQDRIQRALGSGVIISKDGYIITNNHVIDGADKIKVSIPGNKKEYDAKVIGKDAKSDIAVVKIDAKGLNAIKFYHSKDVKVGDMVFAIGNPFGVGETITHGIVSATGRSSVGIVEYEDFIQTDAPINPGNSGGALVNSAGELIGINSAIISRSGGNVGIGFAIPSDMVAAVATQLIENGKFSHAYLGVSITNVSNDMSNFYNNQYGALITTIQDNTPAQKAGLKRGDLIIAIDGKKVTGASELKNIIGSYQANNSIKVTYLRDKEEYTKEVKLGSSDSEISPEGVITYKGISVENLSAKNKNKFGLQPNMSGVMITNIKQNSLALDLGLNKGDIIIQIENKEIKNLGDFKNATKTNQKKRFYIYRNGGIFVVVL